MKIFICSMVEYPRSCATANYIQYLASALINIGYEVIILSPINREVTINNGVYKNAKIKEPYLYVKKR